MVRAESLLPRGFTRTDGRNPQISRVRKRALGMPFLIPVICAENKNLSWHQLYYSAAASIEEVLYLIDAFSHTIRSHGLTLNWYAIAERLSAIPKPTPCSLLFQLMTMRTPLSSNIESLRDELTDSREIPFTGLVSKHEQKRLAQAQNLVLRQCVPLV